MSAPSFLSRYLALDSALAGAGFPRTSPWWLEQVDRFAAARRRRWVIRAGRRAGKSSTLCRLAVAWALWGTWFVPPGDVAVVPFVSVSKDEASARLRTIAAILRTLDVPFVERGDELEITEGRPVLFKAFACNTSAVVGFTSIAVFCDEVARWESRDTGANPAREVVASLAPTMATQPAAFMVLSSSPWSVDDFHAEQFDLGDTAYQIASFAPTWIANPTITEDQTHELEPDERVWSREYAAVPGSTVSAALDPADVLACFGLKHTGRLTRGFLAIDASSLRGDAFAWVAGRETDARELVVLEVDAFEGEQLRDVSMTQVVDRITARAVAWNTHVIYGDQREEASLTSMFSERGRRLETFAWSEASKDSAFMMLRRLMRERRVSLPDHAGLRREMTGIKAHLLPSGRTKYATNGLDYVSALLTLIHAVCAEVLLDGQISWDLILAANGISSGASDQWRPTRFDQEESESAEPVERASSFWPDSRGFG